jgi:hypothetical protein
MTENRFTPSRFVINKSGSKMIFIPNFIGKMLFFLVSHKKLPKFRVSYRSLSSKYFDQKNIVLFL